MSITGPLPSIAPLSPPPVAAATPTPEAVAVPVAPENPAVAAPPQAPAQESFSTRLRSFLGSATKTNLVAAVMCTASYAIGGYDLVTRAQQNNYQEYDSDQQVLIATIMSNAVVYTNILYGMGKRYLQSRDNVTPNPDAGFKGKLIRALVVCGSALGPLTVGANVSTVGYELAKASLALGAAAETYSTLSSN